MSTGNGAAPPTIDLLALSRKVVGYVTIAGPDGAARTVGVKQFTGATYHKYRQATAGEDSVGALYEIAAMVLDEPVSAAEMDGLTIEAVGLILQIAGGQIAEVEQVAEAHAEKNGSGSGSPPSRPPRKGSRATSSRPTR